MIFTIMKQGLRGLLARAGRSNSIEWSSLEEIYLQRILPRIFTAINPHRIYAWKQAEKRATQEHRTKGIKGKILIYFK